MGTPSKAQFFTWKKRKKVFKSVPIGEQINELNFIKTKTSALQNSLLRR